MSASRGISERESNELEPFDLGASRPFALERVAGHSAEWDSIPPDEAEKTAAQELAGKEKRQIERA